MIELWRSEDGRLYADEGGLEIVRWNFSLPVIRKEMVRFQIFSGSGSTETVRFLTLLGPAYLSVSKDPPYILGLVWVRVSILFGNDLSGSHLSYSKGFIKFG